MISYMKSEVQGQGRLVQLKENLSPPLMTMTLHFLRRMPTLHHLSDIIDTQCQHHHL